MQCNLNRIDFDTEPQLTARVEPDIMNKDKISSKQNYINKRSPLLLHEEPNAEEIPPHRYLLFIAALPRTRSARATKPRTHGIWSTSFRLVVT